MRGLTTGFIRPLSNHSGQASFKLIGASVNLMDPGFNLTVPIESRARIVRKIEVFLTFFRGTILANWFAEVD